MIRLPFLDPQHIPVIGLAGSARSGKDTAAKIIVELLEGCSVVIDGFSHRLKISAGKALGFEFGSAEDYIVWADDFKVNGKIKVSQGIGKSRTITGREYFQLYGTEAHRDVFDNEFWIQKLFEDHLSYNGILVVTDVRYANEAQAIRNMGGMILRLTRETAGIPGQHASENPIDEDLIDYEIENDGTKDELCDKLAWILKKEAAIGAYSG